MGPLSKKLTVVIPKSSSLLNIALILEEKNVIKNRYYFIIHTYFLGKGKSLKAGEYSFTKNASQEIVINKLYKNEV
ncbi:MAG: aminodeoxychorismate lyase, partial [Pelagibacterales bacterium]|nr:aminodeoxychorismate lyase [Pelagibacterales bacterium]